MHVVDRDEPQRLRGCESAEFGMAHDGDAGRREHGGVHAIRERFHLVERGEELRARDARPVQAFRRPAAAARNPSDAEDEAAEESDAVRRLRSVANDEALQDRLRRLRQVIEMLRGAPGRDVGHRPLQILFGRIRPDAHHRDLIANLGEAAVDRGHGRRV